MPRTPDHTSISVPISEELGNLQEGTMGALAGTSWTRADPAPSSVLGSGSHLSMPAADMCQGHGAGGIIQSTPRLGSSDALCLFCS